MVEIGFDELGEIVIFSYEMRVVKFLKGYDEECVWLEVFFFIKKNFKIWFLLFICMFKCIVVKGILGVSWGFNWCWSLW